MSKPSYGRWAPTESPIVVEYSTAAMEEVRSLAVDGFTRIARGGVEVGGVLFGSHDGASVRIVAMRPVECSYSRGPSFVLSEGDKLRFVQVLESYRTDPALADLIPVGWFVSHSRGSKLAATESDQAIFGAYFPEPWQILLVLLPGRLAGARAGFFARSADGSFRPDASWFEFDLDPHRQASVPVSSDPEEPRPTAPRPSSVPRRIQRGAGSRRWLWIGAAALIIGASAAGARYWMMTTTPAEPPVPVTIQLKEHDGEMRVEWDPASPAIATSQRATLEIVDGEKRRSLTLEPGQLSRGAYPFLRETADVRVKLKVEGLSGLLSEEMARFIGQPLNREPSVETAAAEERKRLGEENERLKTDLRGQRRQVQALEGRIATLENLLRIERNRSEVFKKATVQP